MPRRPNVPYLPGDLIGFSGYSLESALINLGTWGVPFWSLSHVAIVGPHPEDESHKVALWESTSQCDLPCLVQGEPVSGVQCHGIEERIAGYRGKVYHYPLSIWARAHLHHEQLGEFLHEQVGKSYDALGAFRARDTVLGWMERCFTSENLHALFCSELVVAAWQAAGLWYPPDWRWSPNRLVRTALSIGTVEPRRRLR